MKGLKRKQTPKAHYSGGAAAVEAVHIGPFNRSANQDNHECARLRCLTTRHFDLDRGRKKAYFEDTFLGAGHIDGVRRHPGSQANCWATWAADVRILFDLLAVEKRLTDGH